MCECEDVDEVLYQGSYYCSKCFTVTDAITFEDTLTKDDFKNRTRERKFEKLLFSIPELPWFVRYTLIDAFDRIESHFYVSDRINFINMNQLAIELCKCAGYGEYCKLFKPLKTKARVKQVAQFVRDALPVSDTAPVKTYKLEELPMIICTAQEMDRSKIPDDNHIYTDIDETRHKANKSKGETGKRKSAKTKG